MASTAQRKGSRRDPSWKYGVEIEVPDQKKGYKYLKCNFCNKIITGGVKRMKEHLACTHKDVAPCAKVPIEVKDEIKQYLKNFASTKIALQQNFKERVDYVTCSVSSNGSCENSMEDTNSSHSGSSRGIREPMDRFMKSKEDDEYERMMAGENMTPMSAKEHRNKVCLDIGRFFFENGIPFNCATSPSFFNMLHSIGNYGCELKAPTMHEMKTWILKEEVNTTSKNLDEIKATWKRTGVSLLSDGWSDVTNKSMINFLVNNQYGTVFLKTADASDCVNNAKSLFELLDSVVEEIGEEVVVQVVTDNTNAYKLAGSMLMEKRKSLYWTPCVAHCIELMLEKIAELPQQKKALRKAKRVCNFIYNDQWILNLAKKFAKKDLIRPTTTRFATAFLTLENMYNLQQPLQAMFVSNEWLNSPWAKKINAKAIRNIIMDEDLFWPCVDYSIKTTKPLVDVLRMVVGEKTPGMAFIYGAMKECKETIKKNFDGDVSLYKEILDIIDQNWEFQFYRDLHGAAYYLNPRFRWSPDVCEHSEIKIGLYNCMERLIKDDETCVKADLQLDEYKYKRGLFGYKASLISYMTRSPVIWWDHFGDEVPELKRFATKILGLTCSASVCERNWNTLNQVHTKKRNNLSNDEMNKKMYIMYNEKLKQKFLKKNSLKEEDDPLVVENVSSDDEWIANPNDDEGESVTSRKRKNVKVELVDEDDDGAMACV